MDVVYAINVVNFEEQTSTNGGFPVAISMVVQPTDQMSAYKGKHSVIRATNHKVKFNLSGSK